MGDFPAVLLGWLSPLSSSPGSSSSGATVVFPLPSWLLFALRGSGLYLSHSSHGRTLRFWSALLSEHAKPSARRSGFGSSAVIRFDIALSNGDLIAADTTRTVKMKEKDKCMVCMVCSYEGRLESIRIMMWKRKYDTYHGDRVRV